MWGRYNLTRYLEHYQKKKYGILCDQKNQNPSPPKKIIIKKETADGWISSFHIVSLISSLDELQTSISKHSLNYRNGSSRFVTAVRCSETDSVRCDANFTAIFMFTLPETNSKSTWKWMVGILVSLWDGLFSGAMLVLGRVSLSLSVSLSLHSLLFSSLLFSSLLLSYLILSYPFIHLSLIYPHLVASYLTKNPIIFYLIPI